jgi:hypothetical protein
MRFVYVRGEERVRVWELLDRAVEEVMGVFDVEGYGALSTTVRVSPLAQTVAR